MMDPILYWNDVALEANRVSHTNGKNEQTGPTLSTRALAIVHLAMHDAYAGIPGPVPVTQYLPGLIPAKPGASVEAAVAGAAHACLSALFPSQKAFFDARHAAAGLTGTPASLNDGNAYGLMVAQAMLADRAGDPGASDNGYSPSMARGAHRQDPDNPGQGFYSPFYGERARRFASASFTLDPPPVPGEQAAADALDEVRAKGIAPELAGGLPAHLDRRTSEETMIGIWWAYDGASGIGTPPRLYNQIVRRISSAQGLSVDQNARLFALVNVAMADAGIMSWKEKYRHDLWRPVLAVREHATGSGPAGSAGTPGAGTDVGDPGWLPLGAPNTNAFVAPTETSPGRAPKNVTPPFPSYPSGHATFGAAAFQITRLFCGVTANGPDSLLEGMTFVSDEFNGVSFDNKGTTRPRIERKFADGLWGMIKENSVSRVYLGVHFSFDGFVRDAAGDIDVGVNQGGVALGINIANDIFTRGLHPAP
jgi:hypothetical protein